MHGWICRPKKKWTDTHKKNKKLLKFETEINSFMCALHTSVHFMNFSRTSKNKIRLLLLYRCCYLLLMLTIYLLMCFSTYFDFSFTLTSCSCLLRRRHRLLSTTAKPCFFLFNVFALQSSFKKNEKIRKKNIKLKNYIKYRIWRTKWMWEYTGRNISGYNVRIILCCGCRLRELSLNFVFGGDCLWGM